jgi:hypothetical protein
LDDSGDEAPASKSNKKVAIKKEPETPKPVVDAPKKDAAGYVTLLYFEMLNQSSVCVFVREE